MVNEGFIAFADGATAGLVVYFVAQLASWSIRVVPIFFSMLRKVI